MREGKRKEKASHTHSSFCTLCFISFQIHSFVLVSFGTKRSRLILVILSVCGNIFRMLSLYSACTRYSQPHSASEEKLKCIEHMRMVLYERTRCVWFSVSIRKRAASNSYTHTAITMNIHIFSSHLFMVVLFGCRSRFFFASQFFVLFSPFAIFLIPIFFWMAPFLVLEIETG